jgi:hypothetical protein
VKGHSFGTGNEECKAARAALNEKKAAQKELKAAMKDARAALKAAKQAYKDGKDEASTAGDTFADACEKEPKDDGPAEEISGEIIQESNTYSTQFAAKNVLDATWQGGSHNNGQTWLTKTCNAGWFIMKLQSVTKVKEFHMLNTCNTPYNDRSTNGFSVYLSKDNTNWELAMKGNMQRCTPIKGEPQVFTNPTPQKAGYVKFEMNQCYGSSGGLNFFKAFR